MKIRNLILKLLSPLQVGRVNSFSCSDNSMVLWDIDTRRRLMPGSQMQNSLTKSPPSQLLYISCNFSPSTEVRKVVSNNPTALIWLPANKLSFKQVHKLGTHACLTFCSFQPRILHSVILYLPLAYNLYSNQPPIRSYLHAH